MDIRLHNTLTREKQVFSPENPQRVTMYVCGPTVYSYAHIGNARPPVAFDVLFRLLRLKYGAEHVVYAANITDVDDKIIAAAAETGKPIAEITAHFEKIYREDVGALGVIEPTTRPHATEYIQGMIEIIGELVAKGHAYQGQNGVLFHVPSMANYGQLSGRSRDDMVAGARVEVDGGKKDPADFALWKAAKPGEPKEARWDSPWGEGRPGWHIECSAMAKAVLGETIDIHAGGLDLIFPHHENEIAQSECAHGKPMARYWLHNGFLSMDSEKMSKSLGNVKLIHDLLKHFDGETMRLALMSAHYRQPLDWTESLLTQSKATLDRLYNALRRMKDVAPIHTGAPDGVLSALCDDLNTPLALAELSALATEANKAEPEDWARMKGQLLAAGQLLGLLQKDPEKWARGDAGEAKRVDALVQQRIDARKAKDFAAADQIRKALAEEGIEIMDGPNGSTWRRV
ncbi:MAG TPA: cysteine--tRNA ligase [Hyphomonadaceae bacterium]|nr:cysteine--tRNA ligase [Hyphomonadaceae bacterium]HPN06676.1 cysteine--tRNA ligase [Hyphomonadaceae bacterium]